MLFNRLGLRSLGIEGLERREVLSGNVTATIQGGNLVITGDASNNTVLVTRGAPGQVFVMGGTEGSPGTETLVNGLPTATVLTGFTGDVMIDMREGDDRVVITNIDLPGAINATLGADDDTFALQSRTEASLPFTRNDAAGVSYGKVTTADSVVIFANHGDDDLAVYDTNINGDLVFYGNVGDDTVTIDGTTTTDNFIQRNVLIDMGFGEDTITATRMTVRDSVLIYDGGATVGSNVTLTSLNVDRNVRMYLSIADDNVIIRGLDNGTNRMRADDLVVFTGNGEDDVLIENATLTNLTLDTGHGDEGNGFFGIEVRNLAVFYQLWINSGDGFDNILIEDSSAETMRIFGGEGSDGIIARRIEAVDSVFDSGDLGDVLGLYDSEYERLVVGMYAGSDQLYLGDVRVTRAATFDGGDGDDSYFDLGGNDFQASNRVSIENVDE